MKFDGICGLETLSQFEMKFETIKLVKQPHNDHCPFESHVLHCSIRPAYTTSLQCFCLIKSRYLFRFCIIMGSVV